MKRSYVVFAILALAPVACSDSAFSPVVTPEDMTPRFHVEPDLTLTGVGAGVIDGVMSPGEWDGAGSIDFAADLPADEGGGTVPATLYVMNDNENLYLAVVVHRVGAVTNPVFEFDNDHNGVWDEGDDGIGMSLRPDGIDFGDTFRTQEYGCPEYAWCGFRDADHGGTSDVTAGATVDGLTTYTELSHPLDSGDDLFDFSLAPGSVVGFTLALRLMTEDATWPNGYGDTGFPAPFYDPAGYGHILIAAYNPVTKDDCKKGGWAAYGFQNQGQCIRFVETEKDGR